MTQNSAPIPQLSGVFKNRLYQLRQHFGWSQSDLARKIWGTVEDKRGYTVARKRDAVSAYEAGRAAPERATLDLLAETFGVTAVDLAPELVAARERREGEVPPVRLVMLPGGLVRLQVDVAVQMSVAASVLALLGMSEGGAVGA